MNDWVRNCKSFPALKAQRDRVNESAAFPSRVGSALTINDRVLVYLFKYGH